MCGGIKMMSDFEYQSLEALVHAYGPRYIIDHVKQIAAAKLEDDRESRNADRIDGYDRDDLGESPDY